MAISPPSDILMDVASAADPAAVRAATARLAALAANPTAKAEGFSKALVAAKQGGQTSVTGASTPAAPTIAPYRAQAGVHTAAGKHDSYQKFEAVLLTSFVEAMLPKDDELFGDKQSAGVYRSMMAEQFANQIAKAGGIGIAKAVEHAHPSQAGRPVAPTQDTTS